MKITGSDIFLNQIEYLKKSILGDACAFFAAGLARKNIIMMGSDLFTTACMVLGA